MGKLNLASCCLQTTDAFDLAEMLKLNKALVELDVRHNALEPNALIVIIEALNQNSTLTAFHCDGNQTSPKLETAVVQLLTGVNRALIQLDHPIENEEIKK